MSVPNFEQIANLALLKTGEINNGKGYLEAFDRLFLALADINNYFCADDADFNKRVADDFKEAYQININSMFVGQFLGRLKKQKYLIRHPDKKYYFDKDKIKLLELASSMKKSKEECSLLINALVEYFLENNIKINKKEAEDKLCRYIESNLAKINLNGEFGTALSPRDVFVISKFVKHLMASNDRMFEIYKNIQIGRVCASVIVQDSLVDQRSEFNLSKMNIYLDSGFVFRLLGLSPYHTSDEYLDIVNTLIHLGAKIRIFHHTLNEIREIIDGSAKWINNKDFDETKASDATLYFVFNGKTKEDVQEYSAMIDEKIKAKGIIVDDYTSVRHEYDEIPEANFYNEIKRCYEEKGIYYEERDGSIWNDAKSLYFISQLRNGNRYRRFQETKYLFVTTNSTVSYVSKICDKNLGNNNIKICLTDSFLNVYLWFNCPQYSNLTNLMFLIPSAFHAVSPGRDLLIKMDAVVNDMSEKGMLEGDMSVLRNWKSDLILQNTIVEMVNNDPEQLTETRISDLIESYKKDANDYANKRIKDNSDKAKQEIGNYKNRLSSELTEKRQTIQKKIFKNNILSTSLSIGIIVLIDAIVIAAAFLVDYLVDWNRIGVFVAAVIIEIAADIFIIFFKVKNIKPFFTTMSSFFEKKINRRNKEKIRDIEKQLEELENDYLQSNKELSTNE